MTSRGEPLDERYFKWLYRFIGVENAKNPSRSHWLLAEQLYRKEFMWSVPNDDNRVADGINLRYDFLGPEKKDAEEVEWLAFGCSMLEMLIALAQRATYEAYDDEKLDTLGAWFWQMLKNLGVAQYTDASYDEKTYELVDRKLNALNARSYRADGTGGLFPMKDPKDDQRFVELWYQMAAYLEERTPLNDM